MTEITENKKITKSGYLTINILEELIKSNQLDKYLNDNYDLTKYKNSYDDIKDVVYTTKINIKTAIKLLLLRKHERNENIQNMLYKIEYYKLIDEIFKNALTPELIINLKPLISSYFTKNIAKYKLNNFKEYIEYIQKLEK